VLSGGKKLVSKDLYAFSKPCSRPIELLMHSTHLQPTPKLHMPIDSIFSRTIADRTQISICLASSEHMRKSFEGFEGRRAEHGLG
jgi:hypothetical protein